MVSKTRRIEKELKRYKLTDFEVKVLLEVSKIPRGKVLTYKQIAERIGKPNAYRAVGNALAKNPMPIIIPCHRVIKSNGEIGNYSFGGKKNKISLLKREGISNEGKNKYRNKSKQESAKVQWYNLFHIRQQFIVYAYVLGFFHTLATTFSESKSPHYRIGRRHNIVSI